MHVHERGDARSRDGQRRDRSARARRSALRSTLGAGSIDDPALAVAADGRALVTASAYDGLEVYERPPGGRFGPAHDPVRGLREQHGDRASSGGAAVIAWQNTIGEDVIAVVRDGPAPFGTADPRAGAAGAGVRRLRCGVVFVVSRRRAAAGVQRRAACRARRRRPRAARLGDRGPRARDGDGDFVRTDRDRHARAARCVSRSGRRRCCSPTDRARSPGPTTTPPSPLDRSPGACTSRSRALPAPPASSKPKVDGRPAAPERASSRPAADAAGPLQCGVRPAGVRCRAAGRASSTRRSSGQEPSTCGSTRYFEAIAPARPGPIRITVQSGPPGASAAAAADGPAAPAPAARAAASAASRTCASAAEATTSWCAGARTSRRATRYQLVYATRTRDIRARPVAGRTGTRPAAAAASGSCSVTRARKRYRPRLCLAVRRPAHADRDDSRAVHRFVKERRGHAHYGPLANQRG